MTLSSKITIRDVAEAALEAVAVPIMQEADAPTTKGEERKLLSTSRASETEVAFSKSAIPIKTRDLGHKASALKANAHRFNPTRTNQLLAIKWTKIVNVSEENSSRDASCSTNQARAITIKTDLRTRTINRRPKTR
jgi:hypothetical protein